LAIALAALSCSSSKVAGQDQLGSILDATPSFNGNLSINGQVTLPDGVPSGRGIQLNVISVTAGASADAGSTSGQNLMSTLGTTSGKTVTYTIKGLVRGYYLVEMRVDQNGDGTFGDSGDLDGFYNDPSGLGKVLPPTLSQANATKIPLLPAPDAGPDFTGQPGDTGINFALGPVP
jgi:hypothetical protein